MSNETTERIDLSKDHLVEVSISLYVRVDLVTLNELVTEDNLESGAIAIHLTTYSRRRQRHAIIEAVRRHKDDADRFLVEIIYQRNPELPAKPPTSNHNYGPSISKVLGTVVEYEGSLVDVEYSVARDSQMARRLPFVFPILQDATAMYPVKPAFLPVDQVAGLMGTKRGDQGDDVAYSIAVSMMLEDFQVLLGFPFTNLENIKHFGEDALAQARSHMRQIGLLAPA